MPLGDACRFAVCCFTASVTGVETLSSNPGTFIQHYRELAFLNTRQYFLTLSQTFSPCGVCAP